MGISEWLCECRLDQLRLENCFLMSRSLMRRSLEGPIADDPPSVEPIFSEADRCAVDLFEPISLLSRPSISLLNGSLAASPPGAISPLTAALSTSSSPLFLPFPAPPQRDRRRVESRTAHCASLHRQKQHEWRLCHRHRSESEVCDGVYFG